MDPATGWCLGCQRTLDEIAAWASLTDDGKRRVWHVLVQRRAGQLPMQTGSAAP